MFWFVSDSPVFPTECVRPETRVRTPARLVTEIVPRGMRRRNVKSCGYAGCCARCHNRGSETR